MPGHKEFVGDLLGAPPAPDLPSVRNLKKKVAKGTLTDAERALVFPEEAKIPTLADPAVEAARKLAQRRAKLRKGRRSTILTSGRGVTDKLGSVGRPQARAATLLG